MLQSAYFKLSTSYNRSFTFNGVSPGYSFFPNQIPNFLIYPYTSPSPTIEPLVYYQLAFFTPGKFPDRACIRKLYLVILKSLKMPRPFPPRMHLFFICVGLV